MATDGPGQKPPLVITPPPSAGPAGRNPSDHRLRIELSEDRQLGQPATEQIQQIPPALVLGRHQIPLQNRPVVVQSPHGIEPGHDPAQGSA